MGTSVGHPTRLAPTGRDQVYIDYVEIAPWNWKLGTIGQTGRFQGVGIQLIETATRWSQAEGFRGRVGLHALSQAEDFYRHRCGMTDGGPDSSYDDLRYFEFTEEQANRFLRGNKTLRPTMHQSSSRPIATTSESWRLPKATPASRWEDWRRRWAYCEPHPPRLAPESSAS
jgi:hypothetical protein